MNVIVTGASRGIGRAICVAFAAREASLFMVSRREGPLDSASNALRAKFPDVTIHSFAADLSTRDRAEAVAEAARKRFEHIDILVNNAGAFAPGNVHDEEEGQLEKLLEANLYSAYHLTRALVPTFKRQGSGRIVNMCSVAGLRPYPGGGAYGVAKYALNGFSLNLREELKEFGIGVTTVYPGATLTDSWEGTELPESRFMSPQDIAESVVSAVTLSSRSVVEEIVLRPMQGDL